MEYYPRILELKLDKWMNKPEIIAIKGPRQTGKTTLMLHLKEKYGGVYISFDNEEYVKSFETDPIAFIKSWNEKIIYLDELQYVKNAGRKLKLIYDTLKDVKLIVTGSGSFDIKENLGKYLVGRIVYFELYPLNFKEFLLWKNKRLYKIYLEYEKEFNTFLSKGIWNKKILYFAEFKRELNEYIKWGGYPRVVLEENDDLKRELLRNLSITYLEKDIFMLLGIRNIEKYKNFMKYLASSIGNMLNISNVAMSLHIDYKTLVNYLNLLVLTYILGELRPFYKNLITELRKPKKYYFHDLGLRNSLINNFLDLDEREDKGKLLENFVFNELKSFDLRYWRTTGKAEVDFVLLKGSEPIPIEVKSFYYGKLTRSYKSFLKAYSPKRGVWLSLNGDAEIITINTVKILKAPHFVV